MDRNDWKEGILSTSQILADQGKFEAALEHLETVDCIKASWLRGQIYVAAAEKLSKSLIYMYCGTGEAKQQYEHLLLQAQNHLHKTAGLLVDADREIQHHLNQCLWGLLNKVEHKICETRPLDVEEPDDPWDDEEDYSFPNHRTDDLIDELSAWQL